jgi:hypothetical protein
VRAAVLVRWDRDTNIPSLTMVIFMQRDEARKGTGHVAV